MNKTTRPSAASTGSHHPYPGFGLSIVRRLAGHATLYLERLCRRFGRSPRRPWFAATVPQVRAERYLWRVYAEFLSPEKARSWAMVSAWKPGLSLGGVRERSQRLERTLRQIQKGFVWFMVACDGAEPRRARVFVVPDLGLDALMHLMREVELPIAVYCGPEVGGKVSLIGADGTRSRPRPFAPTVVHRFMRTLFGGPAEMIPRPLSVMEGMAAQAAYAWGRRLRRDQT